MYIRVLLNFIQCPDQSPSPQRLVRLGKVKTALSESADPADLALVAEGSLLEKVPAEGVLWQTPYS